MVFGFGKKKQPDDTRPDAEQEADPSASSVPDEAPKQGMLARLREKLGRTRSNLADGLANLLLGRKQIDERLDAEGSNLQRLANRQTGNSVWPFVNVDASEAIVGSHFQFKIVTAEL